MFTVITVFLLQNGVDQLKLALGRRIFKVAIVVRGDMYNLLSDVNLVGLSFIYLVGEVKVKAKSLATCS